MTEFVFEKIENIVEKGENAGPQHFLLFQQCFQKPSLSGLIKVWIMWLIVDIYFCTQELSQLRVRDNASPMDSASSTAESYCSESTLSSSSKDDSHSNIDLQDSGVFPATDLGPRQGGSVVSVLDS